MAISQIEQPVARIEQHRAPAESTPELTAPAKGAGSPRRRWPRRVLLVVSVVVVVVLGVSAYFFTAYQWRTHPGAKTVSSALHSFHGSGSSGDPGVSAFGVPQAGVYTMQGEGSGHISAPPNSQVDGSVMPVTVTHLASGCWSWRVDFNVAHWEDYVFCPSASGLLEPSNRNFQAWDFGALSVTNLATVTCPEHTLVMAREPKPGMVTSWACPERNTATGPGVSYTTGRVVGPRTLSVGGVPVLTVEQQQTGTLSGTQSGTVTSEWWFNAATGMPIRVERHIVVHSASPIGTITYTEDGSGQLASVFPRT
ncbi:MAG TPA: hypothetical protein VKR22_06225 [Acidimicrobiales bacterium]|nr:hypothetical protein [Acidimicrobiales bacterium]